MGYKELKKALKDSADPSNEKSSRRFSKGDFIDLTRGIMNEPNLTVPYYTNPSGTTPVSVDKQPVQAYRNALKDVVKAFGVDNQELGKMDNLEFTKRHAEALLDVAEFSMNEYTDTGKKLRLPQFSADSTAVTLSKEVLPEKIEATKKNTVVDGKTVQVPTGKTIRTEQRTVTKSSNKVPAWMKREV